MPNLHLHTIFSQAFILGGSPCSGKSTIAEMLSSQHGFHDYKADDFESDHMSRAQPDRQPTMVRYSKLKWDEIWSQSPAKLLTDEMTYYHERFHFILDDLNHLKTEKPVILEGAAFLPELIAQFPVKHENVIFMIPTMDFQLHHYSQRPWIQSILSECHDPKQAFDNWMARDNLFGEEVIRKANELGFIIIRVDGSVDIPSQFEAIQIQFGLKVH
jgi:2-phosphoglycerate kinase